MLSVKFHFSSFYILEVDRAVMVHGQTFEEFALRNTKTIFRKKLWRVSNPTLKKPGLNSIIYIFNDLGIKCEVFDIFTKKKYFN